MKISAATSVCLGLFLFGCAHNAREASPMGRLVFSVELKKSALAGPLSGRTGYFFYQDAAGSLTGYQYRMGAIADAFGGGTSETAALIKELHVIGPVMLTNEEQSRSFTAPFVLDGGEYEVFADFEGTRFRFSGWNPASYIDMCAASEPRMMQLRRWLDAFIKYYGRSKIPI